jgi:hypothetical protein
MQNDAYTSLLSMLRSFESVDFNDTMNSKFLVQYRAALEHYNKSFDPDGTMYLFLSRKDLARLVLNLTVDIQVELTDEQIYDLANTYARVTFKALQALNSIVPDATNIDIIDAFTKQAKISLA